MNTILGKKVVITGRTPKMTCSLEFAMVQSPELVESTNRWMAEFFGYNEELPNGEIRTVGDVLYMNQNTWDTLKKELQGWTLKAVERIT